MKYLKIIISFIAIIFLSLLVSAAVFTVFPSFNLETVQNPWTKQRDWVTSLNQTGFNITADHFKGNGSLLVGISGLGANNCSGLNSCITLIYSNNQTWIWGIINISEWIRPEVIIDVDDEDIETDLNTYVDIAGDAMTGDLIGQNANFTSVNISRSLNVTQNLTMANGLKVFDNGTYWCFNKC